MGHGRLKNWSCLDCAVCPDSVKLQRGCDKPLERPKAAEAWKEANAWKPLVEGPKACPVRKLEASAVVRGWLDDYLWLSQGGWPGAPGDRSAQGARWTEAMETIRREEVAIRGEIDAERRRELERKRKEAGR